MRLINDDLPDAEIDVPEDVAAVLADSGWKPAPEIVQANPALAPGEPETVPEAPRSRRKASETDS